MLSPLASDTSNPNERPPFKPSVSDNTSLSMANHHHRKPRDRRKEMRTSVDGRQVDDPDSKGSSMSLPDRKVMQWLETSPDFLSLKHNRSPTPQISRVYFLAGTSSLSKDTLPSKKVRRWTVAGKARPTRGLGVATPSPPSRRPRSRTTPTRPDPSIFSSDDTNVGPYNLHFGPDPSTHYQPDTPAMITLRRASQKYSIGDYEPSNNSDHDHRARRSYSLTLFPPFFATTTISSPRKLSLTHPSTSMFVESSNRLNQKDSTVAGHVNNDRRRSSADSFSRWKMSLAITPVRRQGSASAERAAFLPRCRPLASAAFTETSVMPTLTATRRNSKSITKEINYATHPNPSAREASRQASRRFSWSGWVKGKGVGNGAEGAADTAEGRNGHPTRYSAGEGMEPGVSMMTTTKIRSGRSVYEIIWEDRSGCSSGSGTGSEGSRNQSEVGHSGGKADTYTQRGESVR